MRGGGRVGNVRIKVVAMSSRRDKSAFVDGGSKSWLQAHDE
jgi:hypothetical protein